MPHIQFKSRTKSENMVLQCIQLNHWSLSSKTCLSHLLLVLLEVMVTYCRNKPKPSIVFGFNHQWNLVLSPKYLRGIFLHTHQLSLKGLVENMWWESKVFQILVAYLFYCLSNQHHDKVYETRERSLQLTWMNYMPPVQEDLTLNCQTNILFSRVHWK